MSTVSSFDNMLLEHKPKKSKKKKGKGFSPWTKIGTMAGGKDGK